MSCIFLKRVNSFNEGDCSIVCLAAMVFLSASRPPVDVAPEEKRWCGAAVPFMRKSCDGALVQRARCSCVAKSVSGRGGGPMLAAAAVARRIEAAADFINIIRDREGLREKCE